jgi:hypothetical protein
LHAYIEKGSVVSVAFADGTNIQKGHGLRFNGEKKKVEKK